MNKHSIIVIKKENKYLQYYDKDWKSYLFPNCKIENKNDIHKIKEYLKQELDLGNEEIEYIGEKTHSKFSERDKIIKEYEHYFYLIELKEYSEYFKNNEFEINSNIFKWFSYNQLLANERIQKVNSDIVSFINEFKI